MDQWISRLGYGRSRCGSVSLWHDFGSRIVQKDRLSQITTALKSTERSLLL